MNLVDPINLHDNTSLAVRRRAANAIRSTTYRISMRSSRLLIKVPFTLSQARLFFFYVHIAGQFAPKELLPPNPSGYCDRDRCLPIPDYWGIDYES